MHRVFLCDDAREDRSLLRAVFEAEDDIEVVGEACDGLDCILKIPALDPDVVLLDLNMPGTGGIEALPGLRNATPRTRFVVLTSANAADAEREAMEAGADAFLQKPVSVMGLPNALRESLDVLDRRATPRTPDDRAA